MNDNLAASARNQPYYQALIVSGNAEVSGVQGNGRKVEATAVIETVHRIAETNGFEVTVEVDQTSHGIQGRTAHRRHHIAAVKALRESVVALEAETGRRLQVLINNAGHIEWTGGPLWDADPESLKDVVEANVLGVALKVNVFAPVLMAGAGPSRIIGLNSGSGAKVTPA